jgi:hypothetical protein
MNDSNGNQEQLVWVTDESGREYVCPLCELKDPSQATAEELENCCEFVPRPEEIP